MSSHGGEAGEDSSEDDDDRGSRGHLGGHSHLDIMIRENIFRVSRCFYWGQECRVMKCFISSPAMSGTATLSMNQF